MFFLTNKETFTSEYKYEADLPNFASAVSFATFSY